jgi:aminoglycoside 3-N-acetyltransferase
MEKINLFKSKKGWVSNHDIYEALIKIGAAKTDILYIHSGLNFGVPNNEISKNKLLSELLFIIKSLNVGTIIMPTYTFSFCNNEVFDVRFSKTKMGVLNEFARKQEGFIRSLDPLMSNVLYGKNPRFVREIGNNSCGSDSTFDLLNKTDLKVKFLFLGTKIGDCFTYMHYMEEKLKVPYRYNKKYSGNVINGSELKNEEYNLFVRFGNVFAGEGSYIYENILLEQKIALREKIGDSAITIVEEKDAFRVYEKLLIQSPSFFIKEIFEESDKTQHIPVNNMISL